ncbi:Zinc finger C2H2-type [Cinara cedri]|uniref:Zinc finger C2H2-type n=1 Tax=Cinara cedri TaxID=506608 RepID=A0A5E4MCS7_9HEMI|nr:Zinc finger C2H2-type [Cinara cedri]
MRHVKIHEGVKFACNLCNKLFMRKDTVAYHIKEVHRQGRTVSCTNKDIQVDISKNSQIEPDINRGVIPTPSSTKIDSYGNDQIEIAPGINVDNIQAEPSTKSNVHTCIIISI